MVVGRQRRVLGNQKRIRVNEMGEEHNETPNKYETLDLALMIIAVLLVWGNFGLVIFDSRGIYTIFDRMNLLLLIVPSMIIWTYLGIVNVRKY